MFQEPDYEHRSLLGSACPIPSCSSCLRTALQVSSSLLMLSGAERLWHIFWHVVSPTTHHNMWYCDTVKPRSVLHTSYNNCFSPTLYLYNWSFLITLVTVLSFYSFSSLLFLQVIMITLLSSVLWFPSHFTCKFIEHSLYSTIQIMKIKKRTEASGTFLVKSQMLRESHKPRWNFICLKTYDVSHPGKLLLISLLFSRC